MNASTGALERVAALDAAGRVRVANAEPVRKLADLMLDREARAATAHPEHPQHCKRTNTENMLHHREHYLPRLRRGVVADPERASSDSESGPWR